MNNMLLKSRDWYAIRNAKVIVGEQWIATYYVVCSAVNYISDL